jgi:hypothetical protein
MNNKHQEKGAPTGPLIFTLSGEQELPGGLQATTV